MKKLLIVVDMQNDFIDGSLGTKEAEAVVPAVKENHAKVGLCLQFVVSPMVTLFHNLHRFHKIVSFDIGRDDSDFLYNHIS